MAEESQLKFKSEEERQEAINELPEINTPENREKLQEIRDAEISDSEPEDKPDESAEGEEATTENEEDSSEEEKPDEEEVAQVETEDGYFKISKEELTKLGFDSVGKFMKTWVHAQDKIERQGERIRELTEGGSKEMQELRNEVKSLQEIAQKPADTLAKKEEKKEVISEQFQKIDELTSRIRNTDDRYSEESINDLFEVVTLYKDVITPLHEELKRTRETSDNVYETLENYKKDSELLEDEKRKKAAIEAEWTDMDEIGQDNKYEEFKLSKPAKEVESEYYKWATPIAVQYYGRKPAGLDEIHHALNQLTFKNPELIKNCNDANIATEPNDDVKRYIELCRYLDIRDGVRLNPDGSYARDPNGNVAFHTRWSKAENKEVPIKFPNLKAAIEHMRIESGFYRDKEIKAFDKGAKSFQEAVQKRDTNELENVHAGKAGGEMTLAEITDEINKLPERNDEETREKLNNLRTKMEEIIKKNAVASGVF